MSKFVHLRNHSVYSLSEGLIQFKPLIKRCHELEYDTIALTDTNNMFAAYTFSTALAKGGGIKPIVGIQIGLIDDAGYLDELYEKHGDLTPIPNVVLLAMNDNGYKNLIQLCTSLYIDNKAQNYKAIDIESLLKYSDDLIILSGGNLGFFGQLILDNKAEYAHEILQKIHQTFGDRLYMELQRHQLAIEEYTEPLFLNWAYEHNIGLVATNDTLFLNAEQYEACDALLALSMKTVLNNRNRRGVSPQQYLKSPAKMQEIFQDLPEAIANTVNIAQRCNFYVQSSAPQLPSFNEDATLTEAEQLQQIAKDGLDDRLSFLEKVDLLADTKENYYKRLDFELGIINEMGFPGYFLIVYEFINWAKANDIPVGPGRGSGAGSVVAWALEITDLDPLRYGLIFERFLNPERVSMPDFDIDICQVRREEVIQHVLDKYGSDKVAQIITFTSYGARGSLQAAGRVLEMPFRKSMDVSDTILDATKSISDNIKISPELKELINADETIHNMVEVAQGIEGTLSNVSIHAAGVIISGQPLQENVALYKDEKSKLMVTQFDMKASESVGMVKFDFLGLRNLSILKATVDMIKKQTGTAIELREIDLQDQGTFELLAAGHGIGVFQMESFGMRNVLRDVRPNCFEDLIAIISLYRPGPMDQIPTYVSNKHGLTKPDYMDDSLEGILKETYGVIIYQEQVMQIAQLLAGYSYGGADLLRRAMGKKDAEEMKRQKKEFLKGSAKKGIVTDEVANEIFDKVEKFASYGFNKSHAAAYALISYHTAWFKANYMEYYIASNMNFNLNDTDQLELLKQDLDRVNVKLLLPNINKSDVLFSVEKFSTLDHNETKPINAVRYGLIGIKGVSEKVVNNIINERKENGPYKDIIDLLQRVYDSNMNIKTIRSLLYAGALDELIDKGNRNFVDHNLQTYLSYAKSHYQSQQSSQNSLFGVSNDKPQLKLMDVAPCSTVDQLYKEKEVIGFFLSSHPLDAYMDRLQKRGVVPYSAIEIQKEQLLKEVTTSGPKRFKIAAILNEYRMFTFDNGGIYYQIKISELTREMSFRVVNARSSYGKKAVDLYEKLQQFNQEKGQKDEIVITIEYAKNYKDDKLSERIVDLESVESFITQNESSVIKISCVHSNTNLQTLQKMLQYNKGKGDKRIELYIGFEAGYAQVRLDGKYSLNMEEYREIVSSLDMRVEYS